MRRKLVVGNWKMHGSRPANAELLAALLAGRPYRADVAVCVPFVFLNETAATLAGSDLRWGAQDVSAHEQGAYTGEVSGAMLSARKVRVWLPSWVGKAAADWVGPYQKMAMDCSPRVSRMQCRSCSTARG